MVVRVRPTLPKDFGREVVVHVEGPGGRLDDMSTIEKEGADPPQILRLTDMTHHMKSKYQRVFPPEATQDEVFNYVKSSVDAVV